MLGLGQQVRGDPVGVVVRARHHHDLRGTRQGVDADHAVEAPLGGGDVGVARPHDLVHRLDRARSVGQGGHGVSAPELPDFSHAGFARGRQHGRFDTAGGRDHGDAVHACDLRRHGVHQHGGGIRGPSARHVDADRRQRCPTPAELHARGVCETRVGGALALVIVANAAGCEGDGRSHLGRACGDAGLDLLRRDPKGVGGQLGPVEASGVVEHRLQAAGPHALDDGGDRSVHIRRRPAGLVEESAEGGGETGRGGVEAAHGSGLERAACFETVSCGAFLSTTNV